MGDAGATSLAKMLENNTTLAELWLGSKSTPSSHLPLVTRPILSPADCQIGDEGAMAFAEALKEAGDEGLEDFRGLYAIIENLLDTQFPTRGQREDEGEDADGRGGGFLAQDALHEALQRRGLEPGFLGEILHLRRGFDHRGPSLHLREGKRAQQPL